MVRLGDVCHIEMGQAPKSEFTNERGEGLPLIAGAGDFTSTGLSAKKYTSRPTKMAEPGDLVLSIRATIGPFRTTNAQCVLGRGVAGVRAENGLEAKFLPHLLTFLTPALQKKGKGATFLQVSKRDISELEFRLPTLDEQRRIAAILDEADRLVSTQRRKAENLEALKRVAVEEFLNEKGTQEVELGTISEIQSGITKGRKVSKETTTSTVPYLSVSNVKDGFLQLHPIKEIDATDGEIARYQLQRGDIVLTEGGDPDKLGRGTVWNNEIPVCIHQNHIFRVRILKDLTEMMPEVLAAILSSSRPKRHFLRSAKQTTGIASINKSQLCRTPIPKLTLDEVRALSLQIELLKSEQQKAESQRSSLEELRQSLSTRAFQGEL